ncbi:MAG: hypothetical protein AUH33_00625 [Chloroflexi bacterium 13_1_40CM_68_21]|nr:MAG: hypothetical protein AUH33_00625 [Chloroflexi bacterium 13_1_40CM_68_21]
MYFTLDGSWEGPVSWRKPIEFGISGGLTALSLAAVMGRLPRTGWLARPCAVAVSLFVPETALIDLQRWRGVPSHFNHDTPFDLAVFDVMGVLVAIVALGIVVMTVWTFVSLRGPRSSALAVRAGMVFLTIGQVLGFAIVTNGLGVDDLSRASIFGAAGEMKIPHAVALHGLQALGVLALLLERTALPESRRMSLVQLGIVGYTLALIVATLQTFGGRAPLDLTPLGVVGGGAALLMLAFAYAAGLRAAQVSRTSGGVPAN